MSENTLANHPDYTAGCMICGEDIICLPDHSFILKCYYCGREEESQVFCLNGHYVCDECHRKGILGLVEQICLDSNFTDPVELAQKIFDLPGLHMHGPEYHSIIPAVIVAAYENSQNNKKTRDIQEAIKRGRDIVGGICGSHGACGAAIGVGIAYSIIHKVTPFSLEERGAANKMTALALLEISRFGGPRCCKRDGMVAIETAAKHFDGFAAKTNGQYVCNQFKDNKDCLKKKCPYFPEP